MFGFQMAHADDVAFRTPRELGYHVQYWGVEDGIPARAINDIVQTPDGYLWIATFNGLARFNGIGFKIFDRNSGEGLQTSSANQLVCDDTGKLWIGFQNGTFVFYENGSFQGSDLGRDAGMGQVMGPWTLRNGEAWFSDINSGKMFWFQDGRVREETRFVGEGPLRDREYFSAPDGSIWGRQTVPARLFEITRSGRRTYELPGAPEQIGNFFRTADGKLGLTASTGIYLRTGNEWKCWRNLPDSISGETGVRNAIIDSKDNCWVGFNRLGVGVFTKDGEFNRVPLPRLGTEFTVRTLFQDAEGNVWIGTGLGLYRLTDTVFQTWGQEEGLRGNLVRTVIPDSDNGFWAFTLGDVAKYSPGQGFRTFHSVPGVPISSGKPTDGQMWIGFRSELEHLSNDSSITRKVTLPDKIVTLFQDSRERLWIATKKALLRLDSTNGPLVEIWKFRNLTIRGFAESRSGTVYIATENGGVFQLEDDQPVQLQGEGDVHIQLARGITVSDDGAIWTVGGKRYSLARFKDNRWFRFKDIAQLPEGCQDVIADETGRLWVATSASGVWALELDALNSYAESGTPMRGSVRLGMEHGLGSLVCAGPGCLSKGENGNIWVAMWGGISTIDPVEFQRSQQRSHPPQVHIESLLLDGSLNLIPLVRPELDRPTQPIQVPPGNHRLEFQVAALGLSFPEGNRYRYRLRGFQEDWVDVGTRRTIHFDSLAPGTYHFEVKGANHLGVWGTRSGTLSFRIPYRWWQSPPFRVASALAFLGLISGVFRSRLQTLKRRRQEQAGFVQQLMASQEEERKRIAHEIHDGLGQNVLVATQLALLGMKGHEDQIPREKFKAIADSRELVLDEAQSISHGLRPPELDRLGLSAAIAAMIERVKSSTEIQFQAHLENVDGIFSDSQEINLFRFLQETLKNIIQHSNAANATIRLRHESRRIRIEVSDDGVGFERIPPHSKSPRRMGLGLSGIEERISLLNGRFELTSKPGSGTRIIATIPFPNAK